MADLRPVQKGAPLKIAASDWNAIMAAVAWVRQQQTFQGQGRTRGRKPTLTFRNDSGYDIPYGGIGWLTGGVADDIATAERPQYPGISRIVVADEPVPDGELGEGWTEGPCVAALDAASYAAVAVGDAVGAWFNQFTAHTCKAAPLRVLAKLATSPYCLCRITGERPAGRMVRTGPLATDELFARVIIVDATAFPTVTQLAPGMIQLTPA